MISSEGFREVVEAYTRYGWELREILATQRSGEIAPVPEGISARDFPLDAAWFSRPPKNGPIAWELRYVGEPPIAFLEHLDESAIDFREQQNIVEKRLIEAVNRRLDKS